MLWWMVLACVEVEVSEACLTTETLALQGIDTGGFEALVTIEERLHSGPLPIPASIDVALMLLDGQLVASEGDFDFAERVELTIDDGEASLDVLCYDRSVQGPALERLDLVAEPVVLDGLFGADDVLVDLRMTVRADAIPASFAYSSELCIAGAANVDLGLAGAGD